MNDKYMRLGFFLTAIAISTILFSILAAAGSAANPTIRVITVKQAIVMNEQQQIDLFISELLEPKSAECFRYILNAESHMNPKAVNASTGAKGIGQLLSSTYHNIGLKHSPDGLAQTVASIAYISRHYGSMCAAAQVEKTKHFY
jgi:hypothetical protein